MGGVRVNRAAVMARLGYIVGCLTALYGLYLLVGLAWALLAAGALLAVSCLLLVDIDQAKEPPQ